MKSKIVSFIIAVCMAITVLPFASGTAEAATKITDKSVYYVTGYISGDCLLTANIYMMRRAAITRGSTEWNELNNTSVPLRSALCVGSSRYSNLLLNSYSYTFDGLTFKGVSGSLSGSYTTKKNKIRKLLKAHPEGIAVWATNAGKGYPHAVLITEYKNGKFYCADSTHNASKYRKKGKNRGIEPFSTCTVSSISRCTKYWYLKSVTGVPHSEPIKITNNIDTGKPVVEWNRILNAKKYMVQRKLTSEKTYKTIATVTTKKYTDKSAVAAKKYHYRIKAYNSKGACIFTGARALRTCDLARPVIKEVKNIQSSGAVSISFEGVKNANKYYVYRATTPNGTYKFLTSVACSKDSGGEKHNVLNKNGTLGKKYYYKVRAFNTNTTGEESAYSKYRTGTIVLATPKIDVNTTESGNVIVSWNAVTNASSYEVYRSTAEDGEFELVSTVEETSYTENELPVDGTKYYYKVKALYKKNSNADSAFSAVKTIIDDETRVPDNNTDTDLAEPGTGGPETEETVNPDVTDENDSASDTLAENI